MSGPKDLNTEPLTIWSLMSPLTSLIHLLMKIMKIGVRGRIHPRDDLSDLKIKAPKFNGNLKPDNYLNWVQTIQRILELKEYNDEKVFKMAILKMKVHASLWLSLIHI